MSSAGVNTFYRQKKRGGITKPSPKPRATPKPAAPSPDLRGASKAALSEGEEETLKRFDLDMRYGPCVGMTRMERWDRAKVLGLDPPADVEAILLRCDSALECLWEGRV